MSRSITGSCFAVLASTLFACGSNDSSSNAMRSTQAITGDECKDPQSTNKDCTQPSQPPGSGACTSATLGGNLCLGADQWIKIAAAACDVQGSSLSSQSFSGQCGTTQGGNGQPDDKNQPESGDKTLPPAPSGLYSGISFTCCAQPPKPPPPPPCMAVPVGSSQTGSEKPDQYVCPVDYALNRVQQDDKGGQVAICCPVQPPPPQECITTKVGDGQTCMDKQSLEIKAQSICAQSNLALSSVNAIVGCATTNDQTGGGILTAEVTCCGTSATPPDDQNGSTPQKP
jgi:hypothetical protein